MPELGEEKPAPSHYEGPKKHKILFPPMSGSFVAITATLPGSRDSPVKANTDACCRF